MVEVRHGDTSQADRRKQAINPPDILITTPETLQVLLVGSRLRTNLKALKYVVVDEIHQLAMDRRGSQLSLGLERLEKVTGREFQRIGLSATVGNPDDMGKFLCGVLRPCRLVDTSRTRKEVEYSVEMPSPTKEDDLQSRELFVTPNTVARIQRILDLIEGHERTLIFVNSRTVAEELGSRLTMLGAKVGVHHGYFAKRGKGKGRAGVQGGGNQGNGLDRHPGAGDRHWLGRSGNSVHVPPAGELSDSAGGKIRPQPLQKVRGYHSRGQSRGLS